MQNKFFIFLSVLITICPFVFLTIYYQEIPEKIPVFVDIKGDPAVMADKGFFSVFRVPLMGVMIQVICFSMMRLNLTEGKERNKILWLSVSVLAAFKMSLTSIEVLIYKNQSMLAMVRTLILISVGVAVVTILINFYSLYKTYKENVNQYFSKIDNKLAGIMATAAVLYLFFVFSPYIFR